LITVPTSAGTSAPFEPQDDAPWPTQTDTPKSPKYTMTPHNELIARALELENDKMVTVGAKASLSLALAPFMTARRELVALHERMERVVAELKGIANDETRDMPEHAFDAAHYSKITACAVSGRYRTTHQALQAAVDEASVSATEHRLSIRRAAAA
jgi:hypothetical protein